MEDQERESSVGGVDIEAWRHRFAEMGDSQGLSTREAAAVLGLSERTIRRAIRSGALEASKEETAYRIDRESLARFAARTARTPGPRPLARIVTFPSGIETAPLPQPLSSFIGRGADVAAVLALLEEPAARLITLTGPGGIGKTRLSLAAASALNQDRFPDGIAFVPLADIHSPHMIMPAIAQALGLRPAQLRSFLRRKRLLLLLDNFEHLLAAGPEVAVLLTEEPQITALVTSRAPLRVTGEREWPVQPMSVAGDGASVAELLASDAGRLFVERAREHDRSFSVDAESAPLIAAACARLDGLPLAIELAAARVTVLTPQELNSRLERRLPLLTRSARNAPARHSTMRDAIAWSYDLLAPSAQRGFQRLAVFSGGFTLDSAESVGGDGLTALGGDDGSAVLGGGGPTGLRRKGGESGQRVSRHEAPNSLVLSAASPPKGVSPSPPERSDSPSVLDATADLLEQGLLIAETGLDGTRRFRMLETIREFGQEQLAAAGAEEEVRARHAQYFLALSRRLRPLASTQATQAPFDVLATEYANLLEALAWLDAHGPAPDFIALVADLCEFWYTSSLSREASDWVERAIHLQVLDHASPLDQGRLLVGYGAVLLEQGDFAQAEPLLEQGLRLLRDAGDPLYISRALVLSGGVLIINGRYAEAEAPLSEALAHAEELADPNLRAAAAGRAIGNLCCAARAQGDFARAKAYSEEALRLFAGKPFDGFIASALVDLGSVALDVGDYELAIGRLLEGISLIGEHRDMRQVADALSLIGCVASAWSEPRAALLIFGAADALRERVGGAMVWPADIAAVERSLAALRESLGEQAVEETFAAGRALSRDDAVAIAAGLTPPQASQRSDAARAPHALTRRERDVLRLMAEHKSDRAIAEALFLSLRTVNWHVRAILAKLEATSRGDAVTRARGRGLL
jgi:excisionase family DNA binding protein